MEGGIYILTCENLLKRDVTTIRYINDFSALNYNYNKERRGDTPYYLYKFAIDGIDNGQLSKIKKDILEMTISYIYSNKKYGPGLRRMASSNLAYIIYFYLDQNQYTFYCRNQFNEVIQFRQTNKRKRFLDALTHNSYKKVHIYDKK